MLFTNRFRLSAGERGERGDAPTPTKPNSDRNKKTAALLLV